MQTRASHCAHAHSYDARYIEYLPWLAPGRGYSRPCSVVSDIDDITTESALSLDRAQSLEWRVELVYRDLIAREISGELEIAERQALPFIGQAFYHLRELVQNMELLPPPTTQPVQVSDGSVGRPYYDISYHQLETLISVHFSVPQIAELFGVLVSTIRRRMAEFDLSVRSTYSTISDAELDTIVRQQFSGWGNRLVYGRLISMGIRVPF